MPINSQVFFFSALPFLVSLIVELVNIKMNNWRMIILPPTTESHSEFFISYEQFSRARFPFPDSSCSKNEPSLLWHLRKPPIPWISCLNTFLRYASRCGIGDSKSHVKKHDRTRDVASM